MYVSDRPIHYSSAGLFLIIWVKVSFPPLLSSLSLFHPFLSINSAAFRFRFREESTLPDLHSRFCISLPKPHLVLTCTLPRSTTLTDVRQWLGTKCGCWYSQVCFSLLCFSSLVLKQHTGKQATGEQCFQELVSVFQWRMIGVCITNGRVFSLRIHRFR